VSRYLNKKISLPETSARRIEEAKERLNYQPNATARNLILGQTRMLGLIVPDITNPFFSTLASAVEAEAFELGYSVLLCNTHTDTRREYYYLDLLSGDRVDGILFLSNNASDVGLRERLGRRTDVVVLDEDTPGVQAPKVFSENENGGYLATRHLLEQGHPHVAYVGGSADLYSAQERFQGYLRALTEFGVAPDPHLHFHGAYAYDYGASVFRSIQDVTPWPSAVFAASDYIAVGILNAAAEAGVRVPEDLSLVGFDDVPFARVLRPPLTTIRQPIERLGQCGTRLLIELLENKGSPAPHDPLYLPVELVVRSSVVPFRAAQGPRDPR
jgi:LacI family transcriptional regulator